MTAQVTIGSQNAPNASAVLDLQTTNKGLLLPRVALTSTTAATPLSAHVAGMTVYNTATAGTGTTAVSPGQYYNDGSKWTRIQEYTETVDPTYMVWFNGTNPNSATAFDDVPYYDQNGQVNTSFVNDNTLKAKTNYMYIGTDGSNWIYNGSAYVTKANPVATEWYLMGTTTDAGNNKSGSIYRTGPIQIATSANAWSLIDVTKTVKNSGVHTGVLAKLTGVLENGKSYDLKHFYANTAIAVPGGATATGTYEGHTSLIWRHGQVPGYINNNGTFDNITGAYSAIGHHALGMTGTNTGITKEVMGFHSNILANWGTITTAYDFYANDYGIATNGVVTNKYGVFIYGATKLNFFQGKVAIGSNPGSNGTNTKLHVFGAITIADETVTTSNPVAGMIRFNNSTKKFQGYNGTAWVDF